MEQWIISDDGIYEAGPEPRKILDVRIEFSDVGESSGGHTATVKWVTSGGRRHTRRLPLTLLGDKSKLRDWLYANAIIPTGPVESVMAYGRDKIRELLTQADPVSLSKSFGWRGESAFVLGNRDIQANSVSTSRLDDGIAFETIDGLRPNGTLDAWAAGTEIFSNPDFKAHAFVILASLAVPILDIMSVQGCVLSLAGPAGTGKTSVMNYGLSAWGHPSALVIAPNSTLNARGAKLEQAKNIPIGIDDLSAHMREINGMMYMVANGRGKSRSNINGDVKEPGNFCTVMMITTNFPMMDLNKRELGEAERRRLIEMPVRTPMPRATAVKLNQVMQENYGVVALPYIQYLIRNRDIVKKRALSHWKNICDNSGIPDASRFGTWLLAAATTAGEIATELGLIRFDPSPVIEYTISELASHSEGIEPEIIGVDAVTEMALDYTIANQDKIHVKIGTKYFGNPLEPMDSLGVFIPEKRELRLRTKALRYHLVKECGISEMDWRQWAKQHYKGMGMYHPCNIPQNCIHIKELDALYIQPKENEDGYRILRKTA